MILDVYPIGSVYISAKDTDPGTLFGGTWEALNEGKTILTAGTNYPAGSTGGAETVKLTTAEIPAHNHSASVSSAGSHSHGSGWGEKTTEGTPANGWYDTGNNKMGAKSMDFDNAQTKTTSPSSTHWHIVYVSSSGGGSAHNNMQPYHALYMWKRIG